MSDKPKPELTHACEHYGCTIRHTLDNDHAVMVAPDGSEQAFSENLGMIAQGAPSATLLAIHAAKADQKQRAEQKAKDRADERIAKKHAEKPAPQDGEKRGKA